MSKHTEGEWELSCSLTRTPIVATKDITGDLVKVCETTGRVADSKKMANARLIAAAPELLAASKKALEFFEAWSQAFGTVHEQSDIHNSLIRAIAKAEGDKNE